MLFAKESLKKSRNYVKYQKKLKRIFYIYNIYIYIFYYKFNLYGWNKSSMT